MSRHGVRDTVEWTVLYEPRQVRGRRHSVSVHHHEERKNGHGYRLLVTVVPMVFPGVVTLRLVTWVAQYAMTSPAVVSFPEDLRTHLTPRVSLTVEPRRRTLSTSPPFIPDILPGSRVKGPLLPTLPLPFLEWLGRSTW